MVRFCTYMRRKAGKFCEAGTTQALMNSASPIHAAGANLRKDCDFGKRFCRRPQHLDPIAGPGVTPGVVDELV